MKPTTRILFLAKPEIVSEWDAAREVSGMHC
jgi:hypothetical protein